MSAKPENIQQTIGGSTATLPIAVRISEACRLTGIGRSKLYELINVGEIDIIKVGTITLVPTESLIAFLRARRI